MHSSREVVERFTELLGKTIASPRSKKDYVYLLLHIVPLGCVITYKALAELVKTSPRAIGSYMRSNRLLVIVPCHRVVASSGGLGGFSLGVEFKKKLLEIEGYRASPYSCIIRSSKDYWKIVENNGYEIPVEDV